MDIGSFASGINIDSGSKRREGCPPPTDLDAFLPWACAQTQLPFVPVIIRRKLNEVTSATTRGKIKEENTDGLSADNYTSGRLYAPEDFVVYLETTYDSDNLVQIKFKENNPLPAALLKLFSLIVQFYPNLATIYINKGLDQFGLYQLSKILVTSNITEVILDNTHVKEANYYILLENNATLKYLSLARCLLNDNAVTILASKLVYPLKASKSLCVLNLSCNGITDDSAEYLGDMLRTNRRLVYLNLSGNMITDVGADSILSSLIRFSLSAEEISGKKERKFQYMMEKKKYIQDTIEKLRIGFVKKFAASKKGGRSTVATTKKAKSVEATPEADLVSVACLDTSWIGKVEADAAAAFGPFQDPFNNANTEPKQGSIYCYGNNTLCYLNLAYNNLTYFSVNKLYEVLSYQQSLARKPLGLINVCIDGNNLPITCRELDKIDSLIDSGLTRLSAASSAIIKKKGKH